MTVKIQQTMRGYVRNSMSMFSYLIPNINHQLSATAIDASHQHHHHKPTETIRRDSIPHFTAISRKHEINLTLSYRQQQRRAQCSLLPLFTSHLYVKSTRSKFQSETWRRMLVGLGVWCRSIRLSPRYFGRIKFAAGKRHQRDNLMIDNPRTLVRT